MIHGSLFSGIGGFDLAAEWMGWANAFHCEIAEFPQKILKYYWPNAVSYDDITKTDFTIWRGRIDVLTGGFPCQPFSLAGKRKGTADNRHLWPEMLRAIQEIKPRYVVGENVSGILSWNGGLVFEGVQADLEAEGYEVLPFILPACAVNAPHRRDRVWFIAHATIERRKERVSQRLGKNDQRPERPCNLGITPDPQSFGTHRTQEYENRDRQSGERGRCDPDDFSQIQRRYITPDSGLLGQAVGQQQPMGADELCEEQSVTHSGDQRSQRNELNGTSEPGKRRQQTPGSTAQFHQIPDWSDFPTQSLVRCGNDGFPARLDGITFPKWRNESIRAYGNAIVPQVAYQIFKAIEQIDERKTI